MAGNDRSFEPGLYAVNTVPSIGPFNERLSNRLGWVDRGWVGRGSWVVGRGSWVVGRGSWVVDPRSPMYTRH